MHRFPHKVPKGASLRKGFDPFADMKKDDSKDEVSFTNPVSARPGTLRAGFDPMSYPKRSNNDNRPTGTVSDHVKELTAPEFEPPNPPSQTTFIDNQQGKDSPVKDNQDTKKMTNKENFLTDEKEDDLSSLTSSGDENFDLDDEDDTLPPLKTTPRGTAIPRSKREKRLLAEDRKLRNLEREAHQRVKELEEERRKFQEKRNESNLARRRRLVERLEKLDRSDKESALKQIKQAEQLKQLRELQLQQQKLAVLHEEKLWHHERDIEIERMVSRKLQLEELQERRNTLESEIRKRKLIVEEVQEERARRASAKANRLQEVIQRAEFLQKEINSGAFDEKDREAFAAQFLNEDGKQENVFRLTDEIAGARRKQFLEKKAKQEDDMISLVSKREALDNRRVELLSEKRKLKAIQAKGTEFMVALERGTENLNEILSNDIDDNFPLDEKEMKDNRTVEEYAYGLEASKQIDHNVIRSLKAGLRVLEAERIHSKPLLKMLPEYKGELSINSYPEEKRDLVTWIHKMTEDLCDEILKAFYLREVTFENIEREREEFEESKRSLVKRYAARAQERAISEITADAVLNVVQEQIREVHKEFSYLNKNAVDMSNQLLIKSIMKRRGAIGSLQEAGKEGSETGKAWKMEILEMCREEMIRQRSRRDVEKAKTRLPPPFRSLPLVSAEKGKSVTLLVARKGEKGLEKAEKKDEKKKKNKARRRKKRSKSVEEDDDEEEKVSDLICEDDIDYVHPEEENVNELWIPNWKDPFEDANDDLKDAYQGEKSYFKKLHYTSASFQIPRGHGLVTCCKIASHRQTMLAVGTTTGTVLIYRSCLPPARLLYILDVNKKGGDKKKKKQKKPIINVKGGRKSVIDISWSFDSLQISVVHADGTGRIWSLARAVTNYTTKKDAGSIDEEKEKKANAQGVKEDAKDVNPQIHSFPTRVLSNLDFRRSGLGKKSKNAKNKKDKSASNSEAKEKKRTFSISFGRVKRTKEEKKELDEELFGLEPLLSCFHPTLTFLGSQTSILYCLRHGHVIKWNGIKNADNDESSENSPLVPLLGGSVAPYEPLDADEDPPDPKERLKKRVQREFFQSHRSKILLMGFHKNSTTTLVTVDEAGYLYIWEYTVENFSGFGWFVPSKKYKIVLPRNLSAKKNKKREKIDILSAEMTTSGNDIVLLIQSPSKVGGTRIVVFNIESEKILPMQVKLSNIEYFQFGVSPVIDATGSDYVYIWKSGEFLIYSIATGKRVKKVQLLDREAVQGNRKITAPQVARDHSQIVVGIENTAEVKIRVIVDSTLLEKEEEKEIQFHEFTPYQPPETTLKNKYRPRLFSAPPEARVRKIAWDISEGYAEDEIKTIVEKIVNSSLEKAKTLW
eukprot:g2083.t1